MWVTKLLISPVIIRIFCPKTTKSGLNLAFLSIAGSFGALLVGWLVVVARGLYLARHLFSFIYMGNKMFDFSSKKKDFFKFGPKLAFLSIAGSFGALLVGWLVVVARAVSRKTPIYFVTVSFTSPHRN